jgi:hypothetical protein
LLRARCTGPCVPGPDDQLDKIAPSHVTCS